MQSESATQSRAIAHDVDALVAALGRLQAGAPGIKTKRQALIRRTLYDFSPKPDIHIKIYSYSCIEWAFFKHRNDLPSLARGLFVYEQPHGHWQIAARGYDKFFNIGEVTETKWSSIRETTVGPYEITLKENGCIIFAAALNGHLLVTSKHAVGKSKLEGGSKPTHAQRGEEWLDIHLARANSSRDKFVAFLSEHNVTAAFELADDEFEEHILEYSADRRGLYLHGINANTPVFSTWNTSRLREVADRFGFFLVQCIVKQTADEVEQFTESCRESGSYGDRPVEGFVVRCHRRADHGSDDAPTQGNATAGALDDFFFKVKYDEPYLMFREWREVTKAILAGRGNHLKPKYTLSHKYIAWVKRKRVESPQLFADYNQNKGIILTRNLFLREIENLSSSSGKDIVNLAKETTGDRGLVRDDGDASADGDRHHQYDDVKAAAVAKVALTAANIDSKEWKDSASIMATQALSPQHPTLPSRQTAQTSQKTLVIPVATVGVGKTILARTLKNLYPAAIEHIQNDNITYKRAAPAFMSAIMDEFEQYAIVIADRNNQLYQHRQDLTTVFRSVYPNGRIIALDWGVDTADKRQLFRLTLSRIMQRGENHQSLTPGRTPELHKVINHFLYDRSPLDLSHPADAGIDEIVSLSIDATIHENALKVATALGLPAPETPDAIINALDAATKFHEPIRKNSRPHPSSRSQSDGSLPKNAPLFFGVRISDDIQAILDPFFYSTSADGVTKNCILPDSTFGGELLRNERIARQRQRGWHVTLAHKKTSKPGSLYNDYLASWQSSHSQASSVETAPSTNRNQFKSDETVNIAPIGTNQGQPVGPGSTNRISAMSTPVKVRLNTVYWDQQTMAITVDLFDPIIPSINKIPHITVATADDQIRPAISNEMLERVAAAAPKLPSGVSRLTLPKETILHGIVSAFNYNS